MIGPVTSARDRDAAGRARNARPRDALGRPLPYGAVGEERAPEGVVRPPDAGRWPRRRRCSTPAARSTPTRCSRTRGSPRPEDERELWRGLAQLAVGLTHALRGNARGAATLLERGARQHRRLPPRQPHGIDVPGLVAVGPASSPRTRGRGVRAAAAASGLAHLRLAGADSPG